MNGPELVKSIEEKLRELNIKKAQFYKDCDISSASFSQWRLGRHFPEYSTLMRINEYLGTSFEISVKKETPTQTGERDDDIPPEIMKLARQSVLREMFEKLTEEEQLDVILQILARKQALKDLTDQK